jgi:hypothetical protein
LLKNWFALNSQPKAFEFRCSDCGEVHKGSPSFSFAHPIQYGWLDVSERSRRAKLSDDLCAIDDAEYFIRGVLEVPIIGADEPFTWGVWVTQSKESFTRYRQTFNGDQSDGGSFGWLTVTMDVYNRSNAGEPLENLACDVWWRGPGMRPSIEIHECDHPLYHDWRHGISWQSAIKLAQATMHPEN